MPSLRPPPSARLLFGVLAVDPDHFEVVREALGERFGELEDDLESEVFDFPTTRTYSRSMGDPLFRKFFVLGERIPQDGLAPYKLACVELEAVLKSRLDSSSPRPVNLDPGILNDCRLILASTRDYAHRLYRGEGIYEEITLQYSGGAFRALPWTFPDFAAPTYHAYLERVRRHHLDELREDRSVEDTR